MAKLQLDVSYEHIISLDNLLEAWREFAHGKHGRKDVQEFELRLMENVFALHRDLVQRIYTHGAYQHFKINDPKPRDIHKATVRDRLLHRAIYRILYPFFDKTFVASSYSCRANKGNHKALDQFRALAYRVSYNHTRTVWVLKCDLRKFFASIDHDCLISMLEKRIPDRDTRALLAGIIRSFRSTGKDFGLPLGNLTSQLMVNIYMNEFDQFAKHTLKAKAYVRYADDFVVLSRNKNYLLKILPYMEAFLCDRLKLQMHPDKVSIATLASGVDFLGWIHFPDHRVLRASTKRKMFRRIDQNEGNKETIQSYLGLLSYGNSYHLQQVIKSQQAG